MPGSVNYAVSQATEWLLKNQSRGGGWAERSGKEVSTLNSAEVIIAVLEGGCVVPGDKRIQDGVKFLKAHQCQEGPETGAWMREFHDSQGQSCKIPDLVRTSFALIALIKAGVGVEDEQVKNGVRWLLSLRKEEDGYTAWGFRRGTSLDLMPSVISLLALMEAYRAGLTECREPIEMGMKYLLERCRNNSGSFGAPGHLEAVHTIYAAMALQTAGQCKDLRCYSRRDEEGAIEWLLNHPNEARKLVEENILIVPKDEQGNYGFLFMTDALLIKVLMNSEFRTSKLAREALMSLREKRVDEGGFYGYRVFSWSTAKAISALSVAVPHFQEFPERQPEYVGIKSGHFILSFHVILAGMLVYLTKIGELTFGHIVIFMALMIGTLLAYGKIGEITFKELFKILVNVFKSRSGNNNNKAKNQND